MEKEFLFKIKDENANVMTKYVDGSVTLKIYTENGRERKLGLIKDNTFYTERKEEHRHIKSDSYGFNWYLMKKSSFTNVMLSLDDGCYYKIPKEVIITRGKVMNFKNSSDGNSFELQIFLPVSIIKEYLFVREGENNL